jgi:hypothetical protein
VVVSLVDVDVVFGGFWTLDDEWSR